MNKSQRKENKLKDLTTYLRTCLNLPLCLLWTCKGVSEVQAIKCDSDKEL